MLKYVTTAIALKAFSCAPPARRMYRLLGNQVGNRRRRMGRMPGYYVERVKRMLRLIQRHGMVRDGDRVIELGTGWLHWEAMTLRLFYDVDAVLFDVWDNRQLDGLKNYARQLAPLLESIEEVPSARRRRAQMLLREVCEVASFDELYERMNFRYVVNESGSLQAFDSGQFDLAVSAGVLEHVHEHDLAQFITETRRVVRNGGWAVHSIDTSDHLSHYDRSMSPKHYLSLSDGAWDRLFDNRVQHINRIQRSQWVSMFLSSRFELVDEDSTRRALGGMRVADRFAHFDRRDLECTVVKFALRAV